MENLTVAVMVTLTRTQRDQLKTIVAERTIADPGVNITLAGLVREIVEQYLTCQGVGAVEQ